MFCGRCGSELTAAARFCSACGAPAVAGAQQAWPAGQPWGGDPLTRLQRPRGNRMIAGVCAGLARHYRWDLTWTRVLTALIAVFSSGAGLVAYVVFWLVMPEEQWMLPAGAVYQPTPADVTPPPV